MSEQARVPVVAASSPSPERGSHGRFAKGHGRIAKRKVGGQPGNLSAARSPWATYWRRRALRPEDAWALPLVADYVPDVIADEGGHEVVTAATVRRAENAGAARLCWVLALAHGDLEAAARFLSLEQTALRAFRTHRQPKDTGGLVAAMAAIEAEQAREGR